MKMLSNMDLSVVRHIKKKRGAHSNDTNLYNNHINHGINSNEYPTNF